MTHEEAIDIIRERFDDSYSCPMEWSHYKDGYNIRYSHSCGDGCCSWSETYFVDKYHDLWPKLHEFFAEFPNGD